MPKRYENFSQSINDSLEQDDDMVNPSTTCNLKNNRQKNTFIFEGVNHFYSYEKVLWDLCIPCMLHMECMYDCPDHGNGANRSYDKNLIGKRLIAGIT